MFRFFLLIFVLISFFTRGQGILVDTLHVYNDSIYLPGTLSYPENAAPMPLIIFVQGSGNVDRNGNQAGTMVQAGYIKALRDSLNMRGLGFYSYDKRSALQENIPLLKHIKFKDYVSDLLLVISQFKKDPRFSGLHLIGHSQGSLVAMMADSESIKSFISIAGPSETIDKITVTQIKAQDSTLGALTETYFDSLHLRGGIKDIDPRLHTLFNPGIQSFLKDYSSYDPVRYFSELTVPTLLIYGEKDLQVPPLHGALLQKAYPNSKLVIFPDMNHVLKHIEKEEENLQSYLLPNFDFAHGLLDTISGFIRKNQ